MKKLILFICLLFIVQNTHSQNWCPSGATWYFSLNQQSPAFYQVGVIKVEFVSTYTENGKTLKKCRSSFEGSVNIGTTITPTYKDLGEYSTYESNNVLYVKNRYNVFDTVLNFGAKPGDSWLSPLYDSLCGVSSREKITVLDTGHVIINGHNLQAFDFGSGLFPLKMYLDFPQSCATDIIIFGRFSSCYKDDGFANASAFGNYNCNLTYIGENKMERNLIRLYPNPTSGKFTLDLPEISNVAIYSGIGSLVYSEVLD